MGPGCVKTCTATNAQNYFLYYLLPTVLIRVIGFRLTKSRTTFYAQIKCRGFHTASGRFGPLDARLMSGGSAPFPAVRASGSELSPRPLHAIVAAGSGSVSRSWPFGVCPARCVWADDLCQTGSATLSSSNSASNALQVGVERCLGCRQIIRCVRLISFDDRPSRQRCAVKVQPLPGRRIR